MIRSGSRRSRSTRGVIAAALMMLVTPCRVAASRSRSRSVTSPDSKITFAMSAPRNARR